MGLGVMAVTSVTISKILIDFLDAKIMDPRRNNLSKTPCK